MDVQAQLQEDWDIGSGTEWGLAFREEVSLGFPTPLGGGGEVLAGQDPLARGRDATMRTPLKQTLANGLRLRAMRKSRLATRPADPPVFSFLRANRPNHP